MTPATMQEFASTLQVNLENYTRSFGPPPPPHIPPQERRPSIEEIYQNFKIADEMLSGSYANSVLIGHSPTEFFFDFITGFYPNPAVSARVYLSAMHIPRFLGMLKASVDNYQKRHGLPPGPPPSPNSPQI